MAKHSEVSALFRSLKLGLALFTLVGVQPLAQAEILYQWKEADGSLTFAPSPPPESSGIAYKVVEPSANVNPIALEEELPTANELARASSSARNQQTTASAQPQASIEYAPLNDSQKLRNPLPPGISAAGNSNSPTVTGNDQNPAALAAAKNGGNSNMEFSKQKSRQCEDLNKRIVALENRMVHSVTGDEMDQAVLAISRYQNSYNHHCNG